MSKILPLLLIAYLAVYLLDGRGRESNESPAKEHSFINETVTTLNPEGKNFVTRPFYRKDAVEGSYKLDLPIHLLVN